MDIDLDKLRGAVDRLLRQSEGEEDEVIWPDEFEQSRDWQIHEDEQAVLEAATFIGAAGMVKAVRNQQKKASKT